MSTALEGLLADGVIDAVIGQLKSGKEAEVWLVEHQGEIVAAKIYKERHARNFRNNAGYREGREVRSSRTARAMAKGSRFGMAATEEAWRSAEVDALYALHAAGVRVPAPVVFYEGILLMELVIDPGGHPAPRLIETPPASAQEAEALYEDLRTQVIRMLSVDLVHGDLSAYNILSAWNGPTLIDFPQTIAAAKNSSAERYFKRDLDGVRVFLAGFAPSLFERDWETDDIWRAYMKRELHPEYVPNPANRKSRLAEARRRGPRRGAQNLREPQLVSAPVQATHFDRSVFAVPEPEAVQLTVRPGETDEEAELRALEATLLRQGGGSRGKPPGAGKDERNRRGDRGQQGNRGGPRGGGNRGPARSGGPRAPGGASVTGGGSGGGTGNRGPVRDSGARGPGGAGNRDGNRGQQGSQQQGSQQQGSQVSGTSRREDAGRGPHATSPTGGNNGVQAPRGGGPRREGNDGRSARDARAGAGGPAGPRQAAREPAGASRELRGTRASADEGRARHPREGGGRGPHEARFQGTRDGAQGTARAQERRGDGGARGPAGDGVPERRGGFGTGARGPAGDGARREGRGGAQHQRKGPTVSFVPRRPPGDQS